MKAIQPHISKDIDIPGVRTNLSRLPSGDQAARMSHISQMSESIRLIPLLRRLIKCCTSVCRA